ncbi:MAG: hypothetical protein PHE56_13005 [Bacteroidales bacterium]|nr:hypothetical protein [Bacteroidales bacterium]
MKGLGFDSAGNLIDLIRKTGGSNESATGLALLVMLGYTIIGIIVGLVLIILFIALTILLYVRVFVVLILAAVSPLAFISMTIPSTQQFFKQWWTWFLRWVFMGPIIALILKIAAILGNSTAAGSTTSGTLTIVFSFIAIIGLMILALMVPFILGGQVFNKLGEYGKKVGGFAINNTHFGQSMAGVYDSITESRKQKLAATRAGTKGGTTAALDTINTGGLGDIGNAIGEYKKGRSEVQLDFKMDKFKSNLRSQAAFEEFAGSSKAQRIAQQDPELYAELMKEGASKGYLDHQDKIDQYAKNLSRNKNYKGNISTDIDDIIRINNKAKLRNGEGIPDLVNSFYKPPAKPTPGATALSEKSHNADQYLNNLLKNINSAKNNSQQQKIISQSIDHIDTLVKEGHTAEAKKHFANVRDMVDNNPKFTNQQSNPKFQALKNNTALNSMANHTQDMTSFLSANATANSRPPQEYQLKNFKQVMSQPMNMQNDNDLRALIHARELHENAGYNFSDKNEFDKFVKDYEHASQKTVDNLDKQALQTNWSQMQELNKYSPGEINNILGRSSTPHQPQKRLFARRNP